MTERKIQLFRPVYDIPKIMENLVPVLEKGWTGQNGLCTQLEDAWKAYTGLPYAHFLNSASAGLMIALALLKDNQFWHDGDEVITTPMTFVATNHAILWNRLTPVFADIDATLCLSPQAVQAKITHKTRAVMYVGLGGRSGEIEKVAEICKRAGIMLILDAAHCAGTTLFFKHIGHYADVSIYSFHAVKNCPIADGGMICFKNKVLDALARKYSWLGIDKSTYARTETKGYSWEYDVDYVGLKGHGNDVMAAIGLASLAKLETDNERRRCIAEMYKEGIKNRLIVNDLYTSKSSTHLFQVICSDRPEVMKGLREAGIETGVHYRLNTMYRPYAKYRVPLMNAEEYSERVLTLPCHCAMTDDDVQYVIDEMNKL